MTRNTNPFSGSAARISPVELMNPNGASPFLLVCEHASNHIPDTLNGLGLSETEIDSHIAWDPGAHEVCEYLSRALDAPYIFSRVSRLVYDCNRSPDRADAIPERSEKTEIPGNRFLKPADIENRVQTYYQPFCNVVAGCIEDGSKILVTIHSFTPIYNDQVRDVEVGVIHDEDCRLADALLSLGTIAGKRARRNRPYKASDGVTHTIRTHGVKNNLANVMIEIRNDLIRTQRDQRTIASALARALSEAAKMILPQPMSGDLHAQYH